MIRTVDASEAETLEGTVARVVFRAPDGGFAVLRLEVSGKERPVSVIGPLTESTPGELLRLEGAWEKHPTHGEQFRARRAVVEVPRSEAGVERYLEGLSGIGPELARRLVGAFGTGAVEVLEKEPWRAAQVKGVGKRRAERVGKEAAARRQEREVMIFLQGLGVSLAYAARIRKAYGAEAVARVRENPYCLARDVQGIGFQVADRIARGMGIEREAPLRIQAGLLHVLQTLGDEGHVYAPRAELQERAALALEVSAQTAALALTAVVQEGAVVAEGDAIYLPRLHRDEVACARRIAALLAAPLGPSPPLLGGQALSAAQRQAVSLCGEAGITVLTGGPGTGKTTVVRTLVESWGGAGRKVLLAAPTGRAAKRLSEASGRPARTVHRLLEWGRSSGRGAFARDASCPLEVDLLVVDEASMLDLALARALLDAVPDGARLVLVGDVDQLPSVGPGRVLGDIIDSGRVSVARLTQIFRQAEGSGIVDNAHRILAGQLPVALARTEEGRGDFYVIAAEEPERVRELVLRLCKERIPQAFGFDPVDEVQVLAPMHRGAAGTEGLNAALQAALNPDGRVVEVAGRSFRVGDKVMQVRNDYDRDVFNGDVGVIVGAGSQGDGPLGLEVEFEGRRVRYEGEATLELELAYAMSVHKSQGSEYPVVVVPLVMQHYLLLRRKLLYTAVTRGKRLVVLVGSERALRRAVEEVDASERHTGLGARLAALPALRAGR